MGTKSTLLGYGLGLLLSLLMAFTGFACSQLARKGIDAPLSQCFLLYLLLALVYGGIMIYKGQPLKAKLYFYCILALFDVLYRLFVIKAYQHTSPTSVMLLSCCTLPCTMVLNWLFFKTKYEFHELVGFTLCAAGLVAFFLSDIHSADRSSGINPLRGDLLIIVAAALYCVAFIFQGIFLKRADTVEVITFVGIYGAILSASQIVINERNELKSILSSPGTMFPFIGFSLAMFLVLSGSHLLLEISGSGMLNFSFLTSSMCAALIQIFVYHEKIDLIYFVGFAAVTLGFILTHSIERDEVDSNNGELDEAFLNHSDKAEISNNDSSSTSVRGAQNVLCYISCIIKIQEGNVRSDVKELC